MLCRLYIEALLVDQDLADAVESLLATGVITGSEATILWLRITMQEISFENENKIGPVNSLDNR